MFYNWEEIRKERNQQKEKEEKLRKTRMDIANAKEKSWELLRLCIEYLKENEPEWCEGRLKAESRKLEGRI